MSIRQPELTEDDIKRLVWWYKVVKEKSIIYRDDSVLIERITGKPLSEVGK